MTAVKRIQIIRFVSKWYDNSVSWCVADGYRTEGQHFLVDLCGFTRTSQFGYIPAYTMIICHQYAYNLHNWLQLLYCF